MYFHVGYGGSRRRYGGAGRKSHPCLESSEPKCWINPRIRF